MKRKKALRRLNKVEALLSGIAGNFQRSKDGLGELLDSAIAAVVSAKKTVSSQVSTGSAKKLPVRDRQAQPRRLSDEGRKRISLAAKKRWAAAKRKGMNAVTGRRLSKTA